MSRRRKIAAAAILLLCTGLPHTRPGHRANQNRKARRRGNLRLPNPTGKNGLHPIGIEIAPAQTHDVTAYPALMEDIDCDPEQMVRRQGIRQQSRSPRYRVARGRGRDPKPGEPENPACGRRGGRLRAAQPH